MKNKLTEPIGFCIQIFPTEEQEKDIKKYFGASRYVYNWSIDTEKNSYIKNNTFMSCFDLNNVFTKYKYGQDWLLQMDSTVLRIAIFDCVNAFKNFFTGTARYPKYRSKKDYIQQFGIRADTMSISETYIRIPCIGNIECSELPNKNIIGCGWKRKDHPEMHKIYYNPRLRYVNGKYTVSFTMNLTDDIQYHSVSKYKRQLIPKSQVIGIDLGCKGNNWIVDSNGVRVSLPDNTKEDYKIEKLTKVLSRKILHQRTNGEQYKETKNIKKIKRRLCKYYARKSNKRNSRMYDYIVHNIIERKPQAVVIEDIRVKELLCDNLDIPKDKRSKFNTGIYEAGLYNIRKTLEYKLPLHNIPLIIAQQGFKSTQICSNCGSEQYMGSKRVYRCHNCGVILDRDLNAAYNLRNYPYNIGILY